MQRIFVEKGNFSLRTVVADFVPQMKAGAMFKISYFKKENKIEEIFVSEKPAVYEINISTPKQLSYDEYYSTAQLFLGYNYASVQNQFGRGF